MAPVNLRVGLLQQQETNPCSEKPIAKPPKEPLLLSLSPELRNCIYSHATHAPLFFTYPQKKHATQQIQPQNDPLKPWKKLTTIPFLGLTQTCTLLRTEFRPLWLATHRVTFSCIDDYMEAFYPDNVPLTVSSDILKRMKSYYDTRGTLQLWFRKDDLMGVSIMSLLKHRVRCPRAMIMIDNGDTEENFHQIRKLTRVLNNTSGEGMGSWIRRGGVMDVTVHQDRKTNCLSFMVTVKMEGYESVTHFRYEEESPGGGMKVFQCL